MRLGVFLMTCIVAESSAIAHAEMLGRDAERSPLSQMEGAK
jgi:hypothetical protein